MTGKGCYADRRPPFTSLSAFAVFTRYAASQFGIAVWDKSPNHAGQRAKAFSMRSIEIMATHSLLRFS